MNPILPAALAFFVWPGLVGSALLAWLYLWASRKLTARLQGRQGPPFYQPAFDFVKLMAKRPVVPAGVNCGLFYGLPLVSVAAMAGALALIPVPGSPLRDATGGNGGDLILLLYLFEVPALCSVLAGYGSRSIYGQVGAAREAVFTLGFNLPFLAAVIALAAQARSFSLASIVALPLGPVHLLAAIAFLLALPARLKSNPFSIANAEQEILAGALTEYNAAPLAWFELAHGLELVALVQLFGVLFLPRLGHAAADAVLYLLAGLALVGLVTVLATATARLRIQQAFRFYWRWGAAAGLVAIALGALL